MKNGPSVLWFRHGLRLHDNPALLEAIKNKNEIEFLPIFIFDGESAGTKLVGYNRMKFLLDSLEDLNNQFRKYNGKLYIFCGEPSKIFYRLKQSLDISLICFEQDCEPIWKTRDDKVIQLCSELNINCVEKISHTLWDPHQVIKVNGGIPPLTYQMFLHTIQVIGPPPKPVPHPDWTGVKFCDLPEYILNEFGVFKTVPLPSDFNIYPEFPLIKPFTSWKGGELQALIHLRNRLEAEEKAFRNGYYLPNQALPNILEKSKSMSAHLRFGNLSVRSFYWAIHEIYERVQRNQNEMYRAPGNAHITSQLIWREYFYTMSVNNINYDKMKDNKICLNIPWKQPHESEIQRWKLGQTGFPLIDAAIRQLLSEGWIHHILRNTIASFLTRGALWISWEYGVQHFLKYLLDADWSVCAGNWMWVSSSAFEKLLDSSKCTCPIALAKRLDPNGEYITRYIPELRSLPKDYIHEPWKAPESVQRNSNCIIGVHYPERMIDLNLAAKQNSNALNILRTSLVSKGIPEHIRPSDEEEIKRFFCIV